MPGPRSTDGARHVEVRGAGFLGAALAGVTVVAALAAVSALSSIVLVAVARTQGGTAAVVVVAPVASAYASLLRAWNRAALTAATCRRAFAAHLVAAAVAGVAGALRPQALAIAAAMTVAVVLAARPRFDHPPAAGTAVALSATHAPMIVSAGILLVLGVAFAGAAVASRALQRAPRHPERQGWRCAMLFPFAGQARCRTDVGRAAKLRRRERWQSSPRDRSS